MATKDGEKTGGRVKGTLNRDTSQLMDIAERLNVCPFETLLLFCKGDYAALGYDEFQTKFTADGTTIDVLTIEPELRAKCAMKAAEFLYPKRKAVEIRVDDESAKSFGLTYSPEKLAEFKANRAKQKDK